MTSWQPGPVDARQGVPPRGKGGASTGCIVAMVGCGALVVLLIIAGGAAIFSMSRSPEFQKILGSGSKVVNMAMTSQGCSRSLLSLRGAIEGYRHDHNGAFPPDLAALSPTYISSGAIVCRDQDGKPLQMDYAPPAKDASDDTVVVDVFVGESRMVSTQTQIYNVRLLKSGWIIMDQTVQHKLYAPGSTKPAQATLGDDSGD